MVDSLKNGTGIQRYPQRGRLLGLDYSRRRCGIAISDRDRRLATPVTTLAVRSRARLLEQIDELCRYWHPVVGIVIGLPLSMAAGADTASASRVRDFAGSLRQSLSDDSIRIDFWDERLSSQQAKRSGGNTDAIAASIILQTVLDRLRL